MLRFFHWSGRTVRRVALLGGAAVLCVVILCAASQAQDRETITVHQGEQRSVPGYRADRISMGTPGVVDVSVLPNNDLLFTGVGVGETEISLWDGDGIQKSIQVVVVPDYYRTARALETLLKDVENASVQIVGSKIVIDGKLLTKSDSERVAAIVAAYGEGAIVNLTTLDRGPGNAMIAQFIKNRSGVSTVDVSILGDTAYLSGYAINDAIKSNVIQIAQTQVDKIVDLIEIRDTMISTEVVFLKVSRIDQYDIGMNVLATANNTLNISGNKSRVNQTWSPMDVTVDWTVDLVPKLNVIFGNGDAQVLARPHITTKSGEKGVFQSGGEYYYQLTGVQVAEMQSVQYGMTLTVQPHVNQRDEIVSDLQIDVKVPVTSSGNQELTLETFSSKNIVNCRMGQSIILSGLVQNMRNYSRSRTPILGDIPILGFFFGNKNKSDQDSELVAIVTPKIITLDAAGQIREYDEAMKRIDEVMNRLNEALEAAK